MNILILDNKDDDVIHLKSILQSSPLKIRSLFYSNNLEGAIDILSNNDVDIILFDLIHPGGNGLDSFIKLQQLAQQIPVIILTTTDDSNLALEAINRGAQDYLFKADIDDKLITKSILYSIERYRISESLRISNERYNLVSRATNDMVWDWDLVNNKVFRNREDWVKVFGEKSSNSTLSINGWKERIHPDDLEMVNTTLQEIVDDTSIDKFDIECRTLGEDGSYMYVIDRGFVIRDDKGKAKRLIGAMHNITEKKLAEEELKRLSLIAKETVNAVIVTDIKGRITWTNEAFTNISGYKLENVLGRCPGDFLQGPETSLVTKRYMRQKINKGKPFECDIINYDIDRKKYWIRIQCQPQFDAKGNLVNYFALQTNITKEKETEQYLMNSERRFRALIENSKDGMYVIQQDGIVLDINIPGQKILGYTKEEHVGLNRNDLIHPDDRELVENAFRNVINDLTKIQVIEYRLKKSNGEFTWIESTFHNFLDEPTIQAIVLHFREINERKIAADLVKYSEEKYRYLFNNNPSSIFIWDPANMAILEINNAAIEEYGYSREVFLQLHVTDLNADGEVEEIKKLAKSFCTNINFKSKSIWNHKTKSGTGCYMEIHFHAIDYYGQKASLAIVNNITERVKLEMNLSAERLKRQQEITAAVITAQEQERTELGRELHDNINQILATTKLYIEYAQTNEEKHDELLLNAKDFIKSAIDEIRNLSKSLSPPSLGELGLILALEELFDSIRTINKYTFHTEWKNLKEELISDQLKLTIFRIVQEQLNNIIKHADAKNVWVKIKMQNQHLLINIKDDGIGCNTVSQSKGVGLKNISSRAELHNGTMQLLSEPGKGCELKISFCM